MRCSLVHPLLCEYNNCKAKKSKKPEYCLFQECRHPPILSTSIFPTTMDYPETQIGRTLDHERFAYAFDNVHKCCKQHQIYSSPKSNSHRALDLFYFSVVTCYNTCELSHDDGVWWVIFIYILMLWLSFAYVYKQNRTTCKLLWRNSILHRVREKKLTILSRIALYLCFRVTTLQIAKLFMSHVSTIMTVMTFYTWHCHDDIWIGVLNQFW